MRGSRPDAVVDVKKDLGAAANVLRIERFTRAVDEVSLGVSGDGDRLNAGFHHERTDRLAQFPVRALAHLYAYRWAYLLFWEPYVRLSGEVGAQVGGIRAELPPFPIREVPDRVLGPSNRLGGSEPVDSRPFAKLREVDGGVAILDDPPDLFLHLPVPGELVLARELAPLGEFDIHVEPRPHVHLDAVGEEIRFPLGTLVISGGGEHREEHRARLANLPRGGRPDGEFLPSGFARVLISVRRPGARPDENDGAEDRGRPLPM